MNSTKYWYVDKLTGWTFIDLQSMTLPNIKMNEWLAVFVEKLKIIFWRRVLGISAAAIMMNVISLLL